MTGTTTTTECTFKQLIIGQEFKRHDEHLVKIGYNHARYMSGQDYRAYIFSDNDKVLPGKMLLDKDVQKAAA